MYTELSMLGELIKMIATVVIDYLPKTWLINWLIKSLLKSVSLLKPGPVNGDNVLSLKFRAQMKDVSEEMQRDMTC